MIAANRVGRGLAFDVEDNTLLVLWNGGRCVLGPCSKTEVARDLALLIADRYREHQHS
jgi:phosphopantothenoylcysteine decarboxylase/phosphopantothenate--cysteine ligase